MVYLLDLNTHNIPPPAAENTDSEHRVYLAWDAPRSVEHERTRQWYLAGATIVLVVAAYGILTGSWTLVLPTLLIGGIYYLQRKQEPVMHSIRIEQSGVVYDGKFIGWGDCEEAWFVKTPVGAELHIKCRKGSPREIRILAHHIDANEIRAVLGRFLKIGSDRAENLMDLFIRLARL